MFEKREFEFDIIPQMNIVHMYISFTAFADDSQNIQKLQRDD